MEIVESGIVLVFTRYLTIDKTVRHIKQPGWSIRTARWTISVYFTSAFMVCVVNLSTVNIQIINTTEAHYSRLLNYYPRPTQNRYYTQMWKPMNEQLNTANSLTWKKMKTILLCSLMSWKTSRGSINSKRKSNFTTQ